MAIWPLLLEFATLIAAVATSGLMFREHLESYPRVLVFAALLSATFFLFGIAQLYGFCDNQLRQFALNWPQQAEVDRPHANDADEDAQNKLLQIQLKRLGCYFGEIDGVWGAGSKQALFDFLQATGQEKKFGDNVPIADALKLFDAAPDGVCGLSSLINQASTLKRYKVASNNYVRSCLEHFLVFPYWQKSEKCIALQLERDKLAVKLRQMDIAVPA